MKLNEWHEVMDEECKALLTNKTWDLVPFDPSMNVVGNQWGFKVKKKGDVSIDSYKVGLVSQGFKKLEDIDFNLVYSSVVKSLTI